MITKGFYTTDNSDLFMLVIPTYQNDETLKAKISLFYKKYKFKYVIEIKNYRIEKKNILHWKRIRVG